LAAASARKYIKNSMKSMRMRWTGYVAHMRGKIFYLENLKGRSYSGEQA
jgi:hypothetical protein